MNEAGLLRTSDGSEIEITQDMLEDFHIISAIYDMPIRDLIKNFLDEKLEAID